MRKDPPPQLKALLLEMIMTRTSACLWMSFALAPLVGCQGEREDGSIEVMERDSAGVVIVEILGDVMELPVWRLSSEPTATLDGESEPYFSNIGETEWLSDGRIVVEDNMQDALYLFGADGTYVTELGDKGDGPGQFQNMTEMTVLPGDSIYVYDRTHDRLSVVHPDAGFVRSVQYGAGLGDRPPLDVFAIDLNRFVVQVSGYEREENGAPPRIVEYETQLFLTDGSGELIRGPVTFPGGFSVDFDRGNVGAPYSSRAIVAVAPGRLVHGSGIHYDLIVRNPDFRAVRRIRWEGWAGPIPEEEMATLVANFDAADRELPPDIVRSLREAMYSPDLQPELRPALSWRSYVDEVGRIWISKFFPSGLSDVAPEWHVLDPTGRPLARMTLPVNTTLAAVSDTQVLIITADSLEVPSLHQHTLLR